MLNNKFFVFYFLISILQFSKSKIDIVNLVFENEILSLNNLDKPEYYFHLSFSSSLNIPNYLQILVEFVEDGLIHSKNSYLIIYYEEDSTFMNQKQFSEISTSSTFLWLNKEQIKNGFYFSVQNKYQDCNFQIKILPKEIAELTFNYYSYSYYINQENQNMKFIIKGEK